ncbi:hypothetical protein ACFWOG_27105 [Kitasatospora sp. NPDC058406]|uniref:hypothetical protein n=1 Tax=Kitasatospora sp. NPDC058406 TaxID=3346483 RepID=UPI0036598590
MDLQRHRGPGLVLGGLTGPGPTGLPVGLPVGLPFRLWLSVRWLSGSLPLDHARRLLGEAVDAELADARPERRLAVD